MNPRLFALLVVALLLLGCVSLENQKPAAKPLPPSPEELAQQEKLAQATEIAPQTLSSIEGIDVSDDLEQSLADLDEVSG